MANQESENEKTVQIPVKISENPEQIYMTGAFGGFTPYDFRIMIYNEVMKQKDHVIEEGTLVRESKYQLIMSPLTAKELSIWLQKNIEAYEEESGEIKVPKSDTD